MGRFRGCRGAAGGQHGCVLWDFGAEQRLAGGIEQDPSVHKGPSMRFYLGAALQSRDLHINFNFPPCPTCDCVCFELLFINLYLRFLNLLLRLSPGPREGWHRPCPGDGAEAPRHKWQSWSRERKSCFVGFSFLSHAQESAVVLRITWKCCYFNVFSLES